MDEQRKICREEHSYANSFWQRSRIDLFAHLKYNVVIAHPLAISLVDCPQRFEHESCALLDRPSGVTILKIESQTAGEILRAGVPQVSTAHRFFQKVSLFAEFSFYYVCGRTFPEGDVAVRNLPDSGHKLSANRFPPHGNILTFCLGHWNGDELLASIVRKLGVI